ncbi:MAG: glutathione S-transferase family protein [Actinomycetota bacterium]|nr:glutathione S-transferase family protein [Actinomycetota bacterium]
MEHPVKIGGSYGSPYSLKMRGVLRYRQISHQWIPRDSGFDDLPEPRVRLQPTLAFPDEMGNYEESMVDSSPQIMHLEDLQEGRSLIPTDPALAFLDHLLEDFADEWCTKMMYHYRWHHRYPEAIEKAGLLLPLSQNLQLPKDVHERAAAMIRERQVGRTALVGSTDGNRKAIEDSYVRTLHLLEAHLSQQPFLFGTRPGCSDFAFYGQLSQLVRFEAHSAQLAVKHSPRTVVWVDYLEDLDWWPVEGDEGWVTRGQLPESTVALFGEVGRTYAPFMCANAAALESGRDEVVAVIDGGEFRQAPFKYQAKCLAWLREEYDGLDETAQAWVGQQLDRTGCEILLP